MTHSSRPIDILQRGALAAADLLLCVEESGRIHEAVGDATLLHHPTADRLSHKNAFELLGDVDGDALKKRLWMLAPGRRLSWDEPESMDGGRRVLVHREKVNGGLTILISRLPALMRFDGGAQLDALADRFRAAISSGRLRVALQPVVFTHSGEISHFEMLARFDDHAPTADLVAAAERTGQIAQLDYLMVKAAVERLASDPDVLLRLAVNVSGASIERADVVDEFCALISANSFRRDRLIVELTESSRISDMDAASAGIAKLRHCGVGVSLDDFGAGATSFGYLRQFEVNGLKFDGCFLAQPANDERTVSVMRNVVRMCAELGIASVGERVETENHRRQLLAAGVRYAQGYLFGAPKIDPAFFGGNRQICAA